MFVNLLVLLFWVPLRLLCVADVHLWGRAGGLHGTSFKTRCRVCDKDPYYP